MNRSDGIIVYGILILIILVVVALVVGIFGNTGNRVYDNCMLGHQVGKVFVCDLVEPIVIYRGEKYRLGERIEQ